jgi:hypothetical protein
MKILNQDIGHLSSVQNTNPETEQLDLWKMNWPYLSVPNNASETEWIVLIGEFDYIHIPIKS